MIAEQGGLTVWDIYAARPSCASDGGVRREAKQHDERPRGTSINACFAKPPKAACDKINAEFVELNSKMRRAIERDRPRPDRLPPASAN